MENKEKGIIIDLNEYKRLNEGELFESFLAMFGASIKILLGRIFGLNKTPVSVTGSKTSVSAFTNVIKGEKKYIESLHRNGLNDPSALLKKSRATLDAAIKSFEAETGIPYPFK